MRVVFALAVLAGSALMFWLEPLVGRLLLPLLGGTPAVWNGCMVFFQAALLGGYALAHALSRLGPRARLLAHAALVLAPLAALPLALPARAAERLAAGDEPLGWLFATLAATVGLPFLALAAGTPLMQDWAAKSGDPRLADPYPLYAISNAGSLAALIAFPFVLEPNLTVAAQLAHWSHAYGAFAVLALVAAGWAAWSGAHAGPAAAPEEALAGGRPTFARCVRWLALSLVPSSLLLGVTGHISLDIAAVPLLWILPLVIYLGTFVIAFARRPLATAQGLDRAVPLPVVVLAIAMVCNASRLGWIALHVLTVALLTLVCHLRLAEDRPAAAHLTAYYFFIALGGVAGGLFNALVAPLAFDRLLEYPIALALACFLRPPASGSRKLDEGLAFAVAALWSMRALVIGPAIDEEPRQIGFRVLLLAPLWIALRAGSPRTRFALAIAMLLATVQLHEEVGQVVLHRERTFFGVLRVVRLPEARLQKLVHGRILHGMQRLGADGTRDVEPLVYFHREGPCGDVFRALAGRERALSVAVVGLGAGSLAAYARPGERWKFYEIDPAVISIARNEAFFTFLARAHAAELSVVAGDARLKLREAPRAAFDLLMLDAFSSDAVPVHLLTREALALYLDKLAPGGLLALHVSSLYLDLEPLLAALARDAGLVARIRDDRRPAPEQVERGLAPSTWVALARDERALGALAADARWKPLVQRAGLAPWTDDRCSVLSVLR